MMGAENWSLSNEKESLETLKYLAGNRFIDEIRSQVQDKTIEWRLDNWNITEELPTVLVMGLKHLFKNCLLKKYFQIFDL